MATCNSIETISQGIAERYLPRDEPLLSGCMVVPAHDCYYSPSVEVDDLLRVNFDRRTIGPDGLYLVEILGETRVQWRGCRRFAREASGLMFDQSGKGEWVPANLMDWKMRIVGHVEKIYRPTD